jgi:pilus assembly protein Flp/PilA
MKKLIKRFFIEEDGVTAIEYGLIAGLIAIVIVGVLVSVGGNLNNLFGKVDSAVTIAASTGT